MVGKLSPTGAAQTLLSIPTSRPAPYPSVVFVHGSGTPPRQQFNFWADQFTRLGFAVLVFDKRGSGSSAGDWREADFTDLARDVLACVDVLKARSDVDPKQIGLFGQSQGGWVAPLAASLSPDIAWLALVSGAPLRLPAKTGGKLSRNFANAEFSKATLTAPSHSGNSTTT